MKADRTSTTPLPDGHNGSLIGTAVGRLEPGICEAALMAGITLRLAEGMLSGQDTVRFASKEELEELLFAIGKTFDLIGSHKAAYYAALHAPN